MVEHTPPNGVPIGIEHVPGPLAVQTALICAAFNCRPVEILQLLLDHGANVEAKDSQGMTSLVHAANAGNTLGVQLLLKNGADINAKDLFGKIAWDYAKRGKHKEIKRLLQETERMMYPKWYHRF